MTREADPGGIIDVRALTPLQVRAAALAIVQHDRENPRSHWSTSATLLGRVQDEGLFRDFPRSGVGVGYVSARAWALEELEMGAGEFRAYVERLWPLIRDHRDQVDDARWKLVSRAHAELLARVFGAGAHDQAARWVEAAINATSALAFREAIDKALGRETFTTFSFRGPVSLREIRDRAYELAALAVLGTPHPDPERLHDPDVEFRLAERIWQHFITAGNVLDTPAQTEEGASGVGRFCWICAPAAALDELPVAVRDVFLDLQREYAPGAFALLGGDFAACWNCRGTGRVVRLGFDTEAPEERR